jgi:hypothetical protein
MAGSHKRKEEIRCLIYDASISQWPTPAQTNGAGPSTNLSKREKMPLGSKEEEDEGEEETLPRSVLLPFPSIPDDATISGKKLHESIVVFFPLKKPCTRISIHIHH